MIAKRARTEEEAAAAEGESNVEGLERGVANLSVHDNASGEGRKKCGEERDDGKNSWTSISSLKRLLHGIKSKAAISFTFDLQ